MPSFLPITLEASLNNVRTAAPNYMSGFSDLTIRGHMLLDMMNSLGNIENNASDIARIWKIKVRQPNVRTLSNTTRKTFTDSDAFEELQVGVRGYESSDMLKELDYKRNQGPLQLINLLDTKLADIGETLKQKIQEGMYRDGDSVAYQDGYQGFETVLGCNNTARGGADADATDRIILPSDSYGGHSTDLGYFGGSTSNEIAAADRMNKTQGLANDFPYGHPTTDYDAMSPSLWNYTSTGWGSGSGLWEDNVEEVMREALNALHHRTGVGGNVKVAFLIAPDLYPGVENHYSSRFRIIQPATNGEQGFPQFQMLQIDGCSVKSEYGCPPTLGYGFVANHMEMFNYAPMMKPSAGASMIDIFGPTWEEMLAAYIMRADTVGNLKLSPKYMCKLAPLAHYNAQIA